MSSEQPSLFDQLTPSDSLRDDLAWIDSLQEDTQEDDCLLYTSDAADD